jgi:transcriptional regulator with XRE-family HTH domain
VIIKEARLSSNLTQEELANRIGTKKSYISRIERGLCDLQVNTLIRIIEKGLGRKFEITII